MRMIPSILVGSLLFLAPACSNQTVAKVKRMADRACACGDAACAQKVEKEFWDYVKAAGTKQPRGSQEEKDEVKAEYNRMRECGAKLASAGTGTTTATKAEAAR